MEWRKTALGDWTSADSKWRIRKIGFGRGAGYGNMYWLYYYPNAPKSLMGGRYTPTGSYKDSVNFKTPAEAKKFVGKLIREERI